MTKAELAIRIGKTPKFINDIINHNAAITPTTSLELEKVLGTPASFWNNREKRYRESIARQKERKRLQKEFKSALLKIRGLTRSEPHQFEIQTLQLCAESGVAVVFTPAIRGAPIYGATR